MKRLVDQIEQLMAELYDLVSPCSTQSVVGMCYVRSRSEDEDSENKLSSPSRQISLLIGVLLSSPEPSSPQHFNDEGWEHAKDLVNRLSYAYFSLFLPPTLNAPRLPPKDRKKREVAMSAFVHYFNSGLLASVSQLTSRIRSYLSPFDDELESSLGISATDALDICEYTALLLQRQLDDLHEASSLTA